MAHRSNAKVPVQPASEILQDRKPAARSARNKDQNWCTISLPRRGEGLVDWINRTRPEGAPKVEGQPSFVTSGREDDGHGSFGWQSGDWEIYFHGSYDADDFGALEVFWSSATLGGCQFWLRTGGYRDMIKGEAWKQAEQTDPKDNEE